ncbi:hypothetical protein N0V93_004127 [Gnomoniopsis smithogilvyi]|uniref:Uncharacterized protein n=1 Tax=Gnomoniopsis smithogilvyi TaxID=1191159 RepID=A0A9W8YYF5_9PEZI|nr:hypothetical protein N0V93_004127 [Gnomoniopsis smithogilvyi]
MASNTDAAYSYNKLLGSDHDTYVNNEETTPALRSSTTPRSWSFTIITLGWAVALLSCATYATTSWHTAKELDAIHELLQQSLTTSSNPPIHVNGTASPHQPTWDHTIPSNTVINIDGVEIQGYRLGYNASYCGEMTNPAGASALGCVLDRVQGGWIPEICSDSELREVWDAMPEFRWYLDEARTQEVPQERVYRGDPDLMGLCVVIGA